MKRKVVIELKSESYMEEQYLLDKFPDSIWLKLGSNTRFYLDIDEKDSAIKAITEWKEIEKHGYET